MGQTSTEESESIHSIHTSCEPPTPLTVRGIRTPLPGSLQPLGPHARREKVWLDRRVLAKLYACARTHYRRRNNMSDDNELEFEHSIQPQVRCLSLQCLLTGQCRVWYDHTSQSGRFGSKIKEEGRGAGHVHQPRIGGKMVRDSSDESR